MNCSSPLSCLSLLRLPTLIFLARDPNSAFNPVRLILLGTKQTQKRMPILLLKPVGKHHLFQHISALQKLCLGIDFLFRDRVAG